MSFPRLSIHCLTVLAFMSLAPAAYSQSVPYNGSGTDASYEPGSGDYWGVGNGTYMGKHTIVGNVIPDGDFFPAPGIFFAGTFEGTQTATAANGDTLTSRISGEVVLSFTEEGAVTGLWFPVFEIIGGTGRFAHASGTQQGIAINPPFDPSSEIWPFDWAIDGTINLGKAKKK